MSDRPRGGRRPEDFPEVRARDSRVLEILRRAGMSRNQLAVALGLTDRPRLVAYSLERLNAAGLVQHVKHGNEGHGYWITTGKGRQGP